MHIVITDTSNSMLDKFGSFWRRPGGRFFNKSGFLFGLVLASLCPKGWASSVQVFIDRVDLYAPGGETRCSAVWSAHLFWVQRAIGSNPVLA